MPQRCPWGEGSPRYRDYHDREWGVPVRDDRTLFEFLVLEGAQAGLSWETILNKREAYRRAFAGFGPERVAAFGEAERRRLLADAGIVRNVRKIDAAIANARAYLALQDEQGSFADYLWGYVEHRPVQNAWRRMAEVPDQTETSRALSRDLKRRGFRFVGPVICYAFMQAVGLVNDHLTGCFRHRELGGPGA